MQKMLFIDNAIKIMDPSNDKIINIVPTSNVLDMDLYNMKINSSSYKNNVYVVLVNNNKLLFIYLYFYQMLEFNRIKCKTSVSSY